MRGLGVGSVNRAPWLTLAGAVALGGSVGCRQGDNRPADWAFISPAIFQPNCATTSCHSPAAAVSGLDLSTPENGYASLTKLWVWVVVPPDGGTPPAPGTPCAIQNGTKVCEYQERPLVTPYDPAGSRVINMLRARNAPRMPPDRPLPELDIELVERWILNGALEHPGGPSSVDAGHDAPVQPIEDAGRHDAAANGDAHRDAANRDAPADRRGG